MTPIRPEFSRRVELARLGAHEAVYPIAAKPAEREALARRFDLLSLDRLDAEVRLNRLAGGIVRVSGRLNAEVVQACVVSLEPVATRLDPEFTVLYGPQDERDDIVVDLETELIEPFDGDAIDIGETVAQQLALALDLYPRAAGASLASSEGQTTGNGKPPDKG
jgi:uncharacterized metal-binding protein YceD (DUF177 family)